MEVKLILIIWVNKTTNTIIVTIALLIKNCWLLCLSEEFRSIHKAPKFKVGDRVMITTYKSIFIKGCYYAIKNK